MKHLLPLGLLTLLGAGCASTSITNLTPSQVVRSPNGLYRFEAIWQTRQQSLVASSLKPYVVIGLEKFPMQPTPVVRNHFQTTIPLPAGKDLVNYRYEFDYEYLSVPVRRENSKLSRPYQLQIVPGR